MCMVEFHPGINTIEVDNGTTILDAARKAGLIIESPCNGMGTCGKCKVKLRNDLIKDSSKNIIQSSTRHISDKDSEQGWVLACETKIFGDISVEIPPKSNNKTLKILDHGQSFDVVLDSYITKKFVEKDNITYVYAGSEVLGKESGNTETLNFGVIVDIGTTTLVASLVDINTGEELASTSSLNPQSIFAQDVLSRIKFAENDDGLNKMYSEIINAINDMIDKISREADIDRKNIYEGVFSGNTCMIHLAAKISPYSLGKYPYTPEFNGGEHISASEVGVDISKFGAIYFPRIISAYVGADITSGILASKLHERKGVTLFVDIGTNGEMAIGFDGKLSASSTAAGPAFEGMNITFGMRAGNGAIELFDAAPDGNITINTIGNIEPAGICGSGLLDIVGELVHYGIINKNGKFVSSVKEDSIPNVKVFEVLKERLVKQEGKTIFMITDKVHLSQKDVRQVQLAKGAIRAGIEFLLKSKNIEAKDVDEVLIAGSFGYHLRAKSLLNIGLLPREFEGKVKFIGNTSKSGGNAFLLNKGHRAEMNKVTKDIEVIELANGENFDKVFVKCLGF